MDAARIKISGPDGSREVSLEPQGTVFGRSTECDVFLESEHVSRQHARMYQDPFGRWIIEDLASRNGVWIDGQKIQSQPVFHGDRILISPFTLSLVPPPDQSISPDPALITSPTLWEEETQTQVLSEPSVIEGHFSRRILQQINELIDRLSVLTHSTELYAETCRCLAREPGMIALVLRIPNVKKPFPTTPQVLACSRGGKNADEQEKMPANLHLSRRILESVRSTANVVAGRTGTGADNHMTLTLVDNIRPRVVLSGPVTDMTETIDVLYLDLPAEALMPEMIDFMRVIVRQVYFARKSLLLSETRAERRTLDRQLSLAREIQTKLYPEIGLTPPGLDVAVQYLPAMWVGGDYCDLWTLENGHFVFAVGDVSGKGLPAALVMSNLHAALRTVLSFCGNLSEAITYLNRHLNQNLPEGMYVTLFMGQFNPQNNQLEYINAGHPLPFVLPPNGQTIPLGEPAHPPLGIIAEHPYQTAAEILPAGTGLLIVTDGVTEAIAPDGQQFGEQRLQHHLNLTQKPSYSAQDLIANLLQTVDDFRHPLAPHDDLTILALLNRGA